ncbi:Uma2 family endonuclease [Pseudanabaena sp. FACHB-1998]|uniref:Uma2 family endonuclease n=1 Tax=Pseudanabaena sp. FACHB-1998 TaxID=2692858 RepID=UPI0016817480|nr:Uma2 family endonuclease [Pseudanabaena sp. FACHB-1998]MBD2178471.1 Uma2 family endonuclease [Pseudanabaena sp. FACHB-1998]
MILQMQPSQKIIYPDDDGLPMSNNTEQFDWIVTIKENLELLFSKDSNVFVAGDLLWYPVEGNNTIRTAPDAMVVFGRPKGRRGSYMQWVENDIAPQVVFEILSPGNRTSEMAKKLKFYERYGVEEYYLYDPSCIELTGWQRIGEDLEVIDVIDGWVSPRLGIRFDLSGEQLELYFPDGKKFTSLKDVSEQLLKEKQRADRLAERLRALGIEDGIEDEI